MPTNLRYHILYSFTVCLVLLIFYPLNIAAKNIESIKAKNTCAHKLIAHIPALLAAWNLPAR